mmetsp:Transcript_23727/g.67373  ORF Transcript_23727/g.67373 Transcript_23727/m.67373 type:complete len:366 (+) Transcript_23727:722-1819(+)
MAFAWSLELRTETSKKNALCYSPSLYRYARSPGTNEATCFRVSKAPWTWRALAATAGAAGITAWLGLLPDYLLLILKAVVVVVVVAALLRGAALLPGEVVARVLVVIAALQGTNLNSGDFCARNAFTADGQCAVYAREYVLIRYAYPRRLSPWLVTSLELGLVSLRVGVRGVSGWLLVAAQVQALKVGNGLAEPFPQLDIWLPTKHLLGARDVGLALLWVVIRERHVDDLGFAAGHLHDRLCELLDGELVRVAHIDGADRLVLVHQAHHTFDEVVHKAKRPGLRAVAVDGDILALDRLHDKVGHHAAVVRVHARPISVENPDDANVHIVLSVVVEEERLGSALAFVVAGAHANGVYVSPVRLGLR